MADSKPNEKTPLMDDFCHHLEEAYSTREHAAFTQSFDKSHEVLMNYEPLKFSSFRVFCVCKGTVLQNPVLVIEQMLITLLFFAAFVPVYIYFGEKDLMTNRQGEELSIRKWLDKQESKMRAFAMIITSLAAMLLSFYTSIAVGRWWTIRTGGVGGIKAATVELEMFISQFVTQEEQVLSAIRRYGRTSLMLLFIWRRDKMGNMRDFLVRPDLLTEHEADQLGTWNHNLHETIWGWQTGIVTMLNKEGKIHSDQMYSMLLDRCSTGRAAVQLTATHLSVRIPVQYVHLLGWLVKLHNTLLAVIMGTLFGAALRNAEVIICIQLFGRTLILPVLFNAILLINAELSDPFDGGATDFPGGAYEKGLEKDCTGMVSARQNMPDWVLERSGIKA
jgi:hypothetical protein